MFRIGLAVLGVVAICFVWGESVGYKPKEAFRNYEEAPARVRDFYFDNHLHQTMDFVLAKKKQYGAKDRRKMGVWEAIEYVNQLVDQSDPDLDLPQNQHFFQTAEALRRDHQPDWFILAGLIHDLGKVLCLFGEEQWAVVGDTFPVGCKFSDKIVFADFFENNPDSQNPIYSSRLGIYEEGCGLDAVHMSWGHDEYLYQVVKDYLPEEALYMIRYHSFYAAHKEGEYNYLMNEKDKEMFKWVQMFNAYDLYSKDIAVVNIEEVQQFYIDLIDRFFPKTIDW